MNKVFEEHKEKRINEMRKRILNSKIKKKADHKTFGQLVEKSWKNINEIDRKKDKKKDGVHEY